MLSREGAQAPAAEEVGPQEAPGYLFGPRGRAETTPEELSRVGCNSINSPLGALERERLEAFVADSIFGFNEPTKGRRATGNLTL